MKMERVKFLWASDEIAQRGDDYWGFVLDVSTKFSLTRVKRCRAFVFHMIIFSDLFPAFWERKFLSFPIYPLRSRPHTYRLMLSLLFLL